MSDFASNCPISGPTNLDWKLAWDIGGMGWSHEYGMFYPTSGEDDMLPMRMPDMPRTAP
jgi:hypothetical protein